ncbi:hypothetical protein [Nostoc sp. FACHB-888]|uniref:hypothetical protein n=1 Tax=Nostoc sp. FACHB-888 TaxID=2692842 RepID=UPI00168703E6|nr:hypothetical protein [Nostoc sp. FACHB-888]MBD2248571.1 hypothetical protein [Nostoc sp. FACHB-888]
MGILTNRLDINFNIDEIQKDFAFIKFTREQKSNYYGAVELDYLIGKDFNAAAVMFQYGKYAFAMFKRPVDVYQLLRRIRSNKNFDGSSATEAFPKARLNDIGINEDCICEAWLAQILLNSLSASNSRFAKYQYCNLTGALLLVSDFDSKRKDCLDIAKVSITSNPYLLEVETVRYRSKISILSENKKTSDPKRKKELQNALKKPHYIFEPSTSSLRRSLPRDAEIETNLIYIECGLKGKKASRQFLDFGNIDNFYKSRAGILHHVMSTIRQDLSKYIEVELSNIEIDQTIELNNSLLNKPEQLHHLLKGQAVNIIDKANNDESKNLVNDIKTFLHPNYILETNLITCSQRDKQDALNIRIIHNQNYYVEMGLEDEYLPSDNKFYRQHLTVESSELISSPALKTSIKELLIKRDIAYKQINLFQWEKLQLEGIWTFAIWHGEAENVIFMEIQPNGSFEFYRVDSQDIFSYQKFQKYKELIINANDNAKVNKNYGELEGLVISNTGDVNEIWRTKEITIPAISQIETLIQEVGNKLPLGKQTGNDLVKIIQKFIFTDGQEFADKFVNIISQLHILANNELDKNSFRKLLNDNIGSGTSVADKFRSYLTNQHNIRLSFPKNKESLKELFDASLNINYFAETDKEAYYFVGDRREKVKFSFKDACHIRRIAAVKGSELIFKQLLPTMDVDFVRTNQSTVIPFPFKYLRECKNLG